MTDTISTLVQQSASHTQARDPGQMDFQQTLISNLNACMSECHENFLEDMIIDIQDITRVSNV
jgi:hypothetical protein